MARLFRTTTFPIPLMMAILVGLPGQAEAASAKPVAIIEDIQAEGVDFEPLDLVYEGDIIELGASGKLKLAYLRSCIVEELEGGIVTVGLSRSALASPNPAIRESVNCDGGGIVPTEEQNESTAWGNWFRSYSNAGSNAGEPLVVVRATMPVFAFIKPTKELTIDRVDPGEEKEYRFIVTGARLDLADERVRLVKGGLYRATSGTRSVLFRISPDATETGSNVISRLVGF